MKNKTLIRKRYLTLKVEARIVTKWDRRHVFFVPCLAFTSCGVFLVNILFSATLWQKIPVKLRIIPIVSTFLLNLLRPVSCSWISRMYTSLVCFWNIVNCTVKFKSSVFCFQWLWLCSWFIFNLGISSVVHLKIHLVFLSQYVPEKLLTYKHLYSPTFLKFVFLIYWLKTQHIKVFI